MIISTKHSGAYAQARDIEQLEVGLHSAYVAVRHAHNLAAAEQSLAGGVMAFTGVDSPLTQAVGMGLQPEEPTATALAHWVDGLQQFFDQWGVSPAVELCQLSSPQWAAALAMAGYMPVEYSSVLIRSLDAPMPTPAPLPTGYHLAPLPPHGPQRREALEAILTGFGLPLSDENMEFQHFWYMTPGSTQWVVYQGPQPVAVANSYLHQGYAMLAGASTLPAHRSRGLQKTLTAVRLHALREQGARWAVVVTEPGSISEDNMLRMGFSIAYARTKWVQARP